MQKYELTTVFDGKATSAKKKKAQETIEKIVKELSGRVESVEDWGVKDLAYRIGKSTTGNFIFFVLELEARAAKSINEKLRTETDIKRYLFVKKE